MTVIIVSRMLQNFVKHEKSSCMWNKLLKTENFITSYHENGHFPDSCLYELFFIFWDVESALKFSSKHYVTPCIKHTKTGHPVHFSTDIQGVQKLGANILGGGCRTKNRQTRSTNGS